jgi:hypothetical protein
MEALTILAVIALILWGISAAANKAKQEKERVEHERLAGMARTQTAEACSYIDEVNRTRAFPTVLMQNVNGQKGEFGLLGESSKQLENKTRSYRLGAGTRVKVGKMPIYLGGSQPFYYDDTVVAGSGDLYLSNKRIIFLSDKRSSTVALKDVLGVDATLDSITIHSGKRQKPYVFTVRNPAIWSLLLKVASGENLESPNLPDGLTLHAEPTGTPGEVNFSARQTGVEVVMSVPSR